jgi:hypothetical protein
VVLLAVAAAACSFGGGRASGDDATTTTTVDGSRDPGGPQLVAPKPGMAGVAPRPFEAWTLGDDGRTVAIEFWSGVEPCYVLDHVDVAYGEDAVSITLHEGHEPQAEDVACIDIGVLKTVEVTLDEPLGDRDVIDGAADGTALAPGEAQPVVLYVSNQSFTVDPVDITVTIDGEVVVDGNFFVEGQHNWIQFDLELAPGDHTLRANSIGGGADHEELLTVDGPLWIVVDYWGGVESEDGAPMFSVFTSPDPVGFA